MQHSLWWKCHYLANFWSSGTSLISKTTVMRKYKGNKTLLCLYPSLLSLTFFLSLSFKKSYLWCQSLSFTHQSLHTNWTALYSPCCLAVRQSIPQVANYRKERERRRHICPSLSALISESTAVTPVYRPKNKLNWVSISCVNLIYSVLCILYHV